MNRFQRTIAALSVMAAFYIGHGLHLGGTVKAPSIATPAYAGNVASATEKTEMLFTSSPDGKKIYMWRYQGTRKPRYLGEVEAILSR